MRLNGACLIRIIRLTRLVRIIRLAHVARFLETWIWICVNTSALACSE